MSDSARVRARDVHSEVLACFRGTCDLEPLSQRERVAGLETKVKNAAAFLDVHVRAMLLNEHGNCAIDSGCSHGAAEGDNFAALDAFVEYLTPKDMNISS